MYNEQMLKRIESALVFCAVGDIKIKFDDGKWFIQNDPSIRKFTRRKRKAESIAAKFPAFFLLNGNFAAVIHEKSLMDYKLFPFKADGSTIDKQCEIKAQEVVKEVIYDKAENEPLRIESSIEVYWLYKGKFYKDTDDLKANEVKALLLTRQRMRNSRINRAKTIASTPDVPLEEMRRGFIPEDVRLLVWERDGGKCVKCGSRHELQFDHIIPYSLGGSSAHDNLQILCGSCNRAKSNSIA